MGNENKNFLYCNQVQIASSPWDVLFSFQRAGLEMNPNGSLGSNIVVKDEVELAMTPAHAKLLLSALYEQINQYEKNVIKTKIPLDETSQKTYDKFIEDIRSSK
jgi:hypothetical protein